MKKSKSRDAKLKKSKQTSKRKSSDTSSKVKSKRGASSSEVGEKSTKKEAAASRKTRWGETDKKPVNIANKEDGEEAKSDPPRVKDLLNDKERLVEYLFLTIAGTSLEELIPDYLKKHSVEELKTACLEELKKLSSDQILEIISGKYKYLETERDLESSVNETGKSLAESHTTYDHVICSHKEKGSLNMKEEESNDSLQLSASSNDVQIMADEENQTPVTVEEIAKDLNMPVSDADLLELELRARAIRSLLKAKNNENLATEDLSDDDDDDDD